MAKKPAPAFDFEPGRVLAGKYTVLSRLGAGVEGEVYLVEEIETGIVRAAKFFRPPRGRSAPPSIRRYARKMHALRHCPILIQFVTPEAMTVRRERVPFLVSEYVSGELLSDFVLGRRGRRLPPFEATHLLHALASGMEAMHQMGEYHGDIHWDNVIVERFGLKFDVKLVDMHLHPGGKRQHIQHDVVDLISLYYDVLGGRARYASHPKAVKSICCGLKSTLIRRKFRHAGDLRRYLDHLEWDA